MNQKKVSARNFKPTTHSVNRFWERFLSHAGIPRNRSLFHLEQILPSCREYNLLAESPFYRNKVASAFPGKGTLLILNKTHHWFVCRVEGNDVHVITSMRDFSEWIKKPW